MVMRLCGAGRPADHRRVGVGSYHSGECFFTRITRGPYSRGEPVGSDQGLQLGETFGREVG